MAANRTVNLYGSGKVQARLGYGEIVMSRPAPRRGWLLIRHDSVSLSARTSDFRTEAELAERAAAGIAELERRIGAAEAALPGLLQAREEAALALLAAQRDRAVELTLQGVRVNWQRDTDGVASKTGSLPDASSQRRRSGKEQRDVEAARTETLKAAEAGLATARAVLLKDRLALLTQQAQAADIAARFTRFAADPGGYHERIYRTGARGVQLWQKTRKADPLPAETLVVGRQLGDVLMVRVGDRLLRADERQLSAVTDLVREYRAVALRHESRATAIEADIALLLRRQRRLSALRSGLPVQWETEGRWIEIADSGACGLCRQHGLACVHGAVESIDRSRARSLLRDWESTQKELAAALDAHWSALAEVRAAVVSNDIALARLQRQATAWLAAAK
jgi:hypothetical protein